MQNSMVVFNFSVLEWKHPFWANLVEKIKIVSLSWNLVPRLVRICRIQWWSSFFCFRPKTPVLGIVFSPLMYNHATSSQLYYKYLQNLQRLHARYAKSAKTTELNLRNIARKTLDKNAMLALSPKPNAFVCWLGNDNNKESIRR